ncbi:MAG: DUF1501 domain-containing protein [Gemmataceae bacterium]
MLPSAAVTRRAALRVGGVGLFGLTFPQLVRASELSRRAARAKTVILLHQWGGPGQHETFDMKPDAPENVRGWFKPASTKVPGVQISEKLPQTAKLMDKLCVVRCMRHSVKMNNHNSAGYYSLTGVPPPTDDQRLRDSIDLFPAYGSIVSKLAPAPRGTATFVSFPHVISDGSITPGQHASFLGKSHNPLFVGESPNRPDFKLPELSLPAGLNPARLESRTEILKLIDAQTGLLEQSAVARGVDETYQKAVALLTSETFRTAFDLTREPAAVRDRYGRTTYGQSCLLARRLAEAGTKFVNVYFSRSIGGANGGWDYHGFNKENPLDRLNELMPLTDQTLSALVEDLDQRGMLETTLVVWVGEFGRTPRISSNGGRDHWPQCYTAVLAGAGAKGGFVYGASDKLGAYPTVGSATPEDLAATMFEALGLDPEAEIRDTLNRPLPISRGKPLTELFA